jgi:hypothetical protein
VFRQTQAVVSPTLHTLAVAPLAAGPVRRLRVDHAASPDAPAVQHFAFQVRGDEAADDAAARRVGLLRLRHNGPGAGGGGVSAEACVLNVEPHESLVDLAFYQEKKPAAFYDGLQLSLLLQKVRAPLPTPYNPVRRGSPRSGSENSRRLLGRSNGRGCVRTRASSGRKSIANAGGVLRLVSTTVEAPSALPSPPPVTAAHTITSTASPLVGDTPG